MNIIKNKCKKFLAIIRIKKSQSLTKWKQKIKISQGIRQIIKAFDEKFV
tara:strand:- start:4586 stop:4732 length:147 start_codon:yes stop_codon:yes gene_type:complete